MKNEPFPICIIGAGASGFMAAYAASRARPACARLLERENRAGRKLLATGNGRCNLFSAQPQRQRIVRHDAAGVLR
ncbi:MAG: NAD(P)/FAD-dependent oxidoreductase, partial [Clostridia bacterium]|nr:NAD(P)/FAD-dependent oxidoreductase [Clostridia bacterium]